MTQFTAQPAGRIALLTASCAQKAGTDASLSEAGAGSRRGTALKDLIR